MRCSQCGTENTDEMKFCTNCGAKLVAPPITCPKCGAEVSPGVRFCGQCGQDVTQPIEEEATTTTCPECGAEISPEVKFCGQCGQDVTQTVVKEVAKPAPRVRPRAEAGVEENTSGQGSLAVIPEEIRGWNWGAFVLGWIWGIGNNVWLAFLGLIPFAAPIMAVILGLKGNEWAWRSKRYDSVERFTATQDTWSKWGKWVLIGNAALFLLIILFRTVVG